MKLRPRLTYANVISTLCLFLLLGGGAAFAATQLPKNSVGAKQLKKSAVTPAKLAKATRKQLAGKPGPAGPQGPAGATGTGPAYEALPSKGGGVELGPVETERTFDTLSDLPAGSYAITAKLILFSGREEISQVGCQLKADGAPGSSEPPDEGLALVGGNSPSFAGAPYIVLQELHTFNAPGGDVRIVCSEAGGKEVEEEPSEVVGPRIQAVRVQSASSTTG